MSEFSNERANSIIETSLTELAFIFFFILLIFAAWKINDIENELVDNIEDKNALTNQINKLQKSLSEVSEFFALESNMNPEELFDELILGRQAVKDLEKANEKLDVLNTSLTEVLKASSTNSIDELVKEIKELEKAKNLISEKYLGDGEFSEKIEDIVKQNTNYKGQNKNLRNKIESIGNGLDHPPCWADEITGSIQYVYNVIIKEDSIEVLEGWPVVRDEEATSNPNITSVIGSYSSNSALWSKSENLFQESVVQDCRHFVRIYDHAESKKAFKNYLLGIENHFYKFLRKDLYVKE